MKYRFRSFFYHCKKRPLILWLLFFMWLALCTFFFLVAIRDFHSPFAPLSYLPMLLPILNLCLCTKPVRSLEWLHVAAMYFSAAHIFCYIMLAYSTWLFLSLGLFWVAAVCLPLLIDDKLVISRKSFHIE